MRAIILAAGQGTRLRPLTNTIPKCLVEVEGKTLLERQIETLAHCGIQNIVVVTGYQSSKIQIPGIVKCQNSRYKTTNMVASLFCAEKYMDSEIVLSYGDIIYAPAILKKLLKSRQDIAVVVDLNWRNLWEMRFENPLEDAESLIFDSGGRILQIGQKTQDYSNIMAQYIGLMKFTREGIRLLQMNYQKARKDILKKQKAFGKFHSIQTLYMTDILQGMIDSECSVYAVKIKGGWLEVDSEKDISLFPRIFHGTS